MKEDILTYINDTFNPDMKEVIQRTIRIFDLFEVEEVEDALTNLIMTHSDMDPAQLQDSFLGTINNTINKIFLTHTLTFEYDVPLSARNELLSSLFIVQDLDDYSIIDQVLNEQSSNVAEKISIILSYYCVLDYSNILYWLTGYDDSFLHAIAELSENNKELMKNNQLYNMDEVDKINNIIKIEEQYRDYNDMTSLGMYLIKKGFKPNWELDNYLNFVQNDIIAIDSESLERGIPSFSIIVMNVISLLLLSKEGYTAFESGLDSFYTVALDNLDKMMPNVTPRIKDGVIENIKGFYDYLEKSKESTDEQE